LLSPPADADNNSKENKEIKQEIKLANKKSQVVGVYTPWPLCNFSPSLSLSIDGQLFFALVKKQHRQKPSKNRRGR
jgi:hypothetical protein